MPSVAVAFLVVALQQGVAQSEGYTSPPSGDTVGYWQQRISYTITATLDEPGQLVRARGTLTYVNNSPDTLRVMYFHQYLNAFRPGSKWSEVDEREGRERFQHLQEPDYGYERFTAPVRVNGVTVVVDYPGAPDSTVARLTLPAPLSPRDSLLVAFEWEARPSTVLRRQGRRGRQWDLAQWYPKVAVYDRGGWEQNALRPAGEFYGEFGTYDVMLVVPQDQVIAATGVPVSGDPGWSRVIRDGEMRPATNAYDAVRARAPVDAAPGFKAVRFFARDVHHFAWSVSPDYRYEGGTLVRRVPDMRWPTWDTVSVHVLYRPGDDTTWGGMRAVRRTLAALQWLEALYGPYAYPQLTAAHFVSGNGSETPMLMLNGSPSQGLLLHEGGHMYTYGALANNEWRSGWMDEGLTSYQTDWAQIFTPQERVRAGIVDQPAPRTGYRARGLRMALPRFEHIALDQASLDLLGEAQPIGTPSHEFRDFAAYQGMIYDRAQIMFGQLRDVLGDSVFVEFTHDYYARWALKHVDERAMRASAERVSGKDLGWFFDQWLRRTGVMDYALDRVVTSRDSAGMYITRATARRRGELRHPMTLGIRTATGWTFARVGDESKDRITATLMTADAPVEVRLDPHHFTWDWDRRNNSRDRGARANFDWPFLVQTDRERSVRLWRPMAWYSEPGGVTVGLRQRTNYLGWLDEWEYGLVAATRGGSPSSRLDAAQRLQFWAQAKNPYLPFMGRPAIGWRAGIASLDDVLKLEIGRRRDRAVSRRTRVDDVALSYTRALDDRLLPELWRNDPSAWSADLAARTRWEIGRADGGYWFVEPRFVAGGCTNCSYAKVEGSAGRVSMLANDARISARAYYGEVFARNDVPGQRALLVSAADPISTFDNNWWRPRESVLKQSAVNGLPLGGAALRGYHWSVAASRVVAANAELSHRVGDVTGDFGVVSVWLTAFGDAAYQWADKRKRGETLSDAGAGLNFRGELYDRDIDVRFDFPVFVSQPSLAIDRGHAGKGQLAPRWAITFNDIW